MDNRRNNKLSPPAVGGVSLLVVFAVLSLTVFALLSLATVQADVRLADASVQAVSDYYAADVKAQEILACLRSGQPAPDGAVVISDNAGRPVWAYAVPISDTQELQVEAAVGTDSYEILRWQAVPVGEWEPEDSLELWRGDIS